MSDTIANGIIVPVTVTTQAKPENGIGKRLKAIRLSIIQPNGKPLGSNELGRRAGLKVGYVSRIEKGKRLNPRSAEMLKIAEALGVDANWLLTGNGEPYPADTAPMQSRVEDTYPNRQRAISTAVEWGLPTEAIRAVQAIDTPDRRDRSPFWWFRRIEMAMEDYREAEP